MASIFLEDIVSNIIEKFIERFSDEKNLTTDSRESLDTLVELTEHIFELVDYPDTTDELFQDIVEMLFGCLVATASNLLGEDDVDVGRLSICISDERFVKKNLSYFRRQFKKVEKNGSDDTGCV